MGHGSDMKDWIRLGQCVIAHMISKRTFLAQRFARIHIAFDHKISIRRHLQIVRFALHQFDRFFAEVTGEEKFVEAIGQRRRGGEGEHRIAAKENDNRHARGGFVIAPAVSGADFLELPVHAGGALVVDLDAIHADIAFASVWIFGDDAGERDETSAVQGPAFLDREIEQSGKLRIEN